MKSYDESCDEILRGHFTKQSTTKFYDEVLRRSFTMKFCEEILRKQITTKFHHEIYVEIFTKCVISLEILYGFQQMKY